MLKVLDYFNLGDIYKFLPDDQREGVRSRAQSIGEPGMNGSPGILPANGEGGNADGWLLFNHAPQAQKPDIASLHNRNSSGPNVKFPTVSGSPVSKDEHARASSSSMNLRVQELVGNDIVKDNEDDDDAEFFDDSDADSSQVLEVRSSSSFARSCSSSQKIVLNKSKYQSTSPSSPINTKPRILRRTMPNNAGRTEEEEEEEEEEVDIDMDENYFGTPTNAVMTAELSGSPIEFSSGKNRFTPSVRKPFDEEDDEKEEMAKEKGMNNDGDEEKDEDEKDEMTEDKGMSSGDSDRYVFDDNIGDDENLRMSYMKTCPNVAITIVGQEPNGVLLLCVHSKDKTFLDMFTIRDMEMECLCTWNGKLDIVSASVDDGCRVVAVSIRKTLSLRDITNDKRLYKLYQEDKREGNDRYTVYSTFVECINDSTGKRPWVGERSFHPQEVHFTCNPNKNTLQLLHITLSVSITTYAITLGSPIFFKVLYIKKKPRIQATIAGEYLWSRYDSRYKVIHCLSFRKDDSFLEFKTISLKKPVPKVVVKCPMFSFFGIKKNDFFSPSWGTYPLPYAIGAINERPPPPLPCITTVVLPISQSICVCVQHELDARNPDCYFIPVSIVPVSLQSRIDYSIPIPRDTTNAENIRVLFGNIADFLMIFIPGTYLHLLDISSNHNPGAGVILTGEDTMSFVAKIGKAESRWKGAPLALLNLTYYDKRASGIKQMLKHTFLDMRTGVICEFSFDKKSILKLIEIGVSFPKILHIAMLHVRDDELVDYVVRKVLEGPSRFITPDFFKEYIIGQTFLSLKRHFPHKVLLGTPSTLVDQDKDLFKELVATKKLSRIFICPVTSPRGGIESESISSYTQRSFWRPILPNSGPPRPFIKQSTLYTVKKPTISLKTKYMDSYMRLVKIASDNCVTDSSLLTPTGKGLNAVIQGWMNSISTMYPSMLSDAKVQYYAELYHAYQANFAEMLFSIIVCILPVDLNAKRDPRLRKLFLALELFRSAITELDGTFLPSGFEKKFSDIGYHCLTKPIFLQYISRGLMTVSGELVFTLYDKGVHKSDPEFFYIVLCGLPLYKAVEVFLSDPQHPPPPLFLVEFFIDKLRCSSSSLTCDLTKNSLFYPLETFVSSLKESAKILSYGKLDKDSFLPQKIRENVKDIEILARIAKMVDVEYFLPTLKFDDDK